MLLPSHRAAPRPCVRWRRDGQNKSAPHPNPTPTLSHARSCLWHASRCARGEGAHRACCSASTHGPLLAALMVRDGARPICRVETHPYKARLLTMRADHRGRLPSKPDKWGWQNPGLKRPCLRCDQVAQGGDARNKKDRRALITNERL
jgi:hypothetical protein